MNKKTGIKIKIEKEHILQSITDILTTRIGTRVMRRNYGSLLPDLIDSPQNDANILKQYASIADSLMRFEPRIVLDSIEISTTRDGKQTATLGAFIRSINASNNSKASLSLAVVL